MPCPRPSEKQGVNVYCVPLSLLSPNSAARCMPHLGLRADMNWCIDGHPVLGVNEKKRLAWIIVVQVFGESIFIVPDDRSIHDDTVREYQLMPMAHDQPFIALLLASHS